MKILMFAHQLDIGGSQTNAIDLATALRDLHGHDVVLFAAPGPMVKLVKERGIRFVAAPISPVHPSPARMCALRETVRCERPDLIHVWDWWQCLDAYYGVYLPMRIPMVVSDTLMETTRLLPKEVPTTFGTPELADQAKAMGRRRVGLVVPPVDIHWNAPDTVDPKAFRQQWGIGKQDILLVTVSRIVEQLKGESLLGTIEVVRRLGRQIPLRFVIVGEGSARAKLAQLAAHVNAELGRPAVLVTGPLLDPRPAYAAADIVVGMGGSALRGMAFEKPVIIVGEQGFSAPLTPDTAQSFYYKGIYGRGDCSFSNGALESDIRGLIERNGELAALGQFSRRFVVQHFSLEAVSAQLADFCRAAAAELPPLQAAAANAIRTSAIYLRERRFLIRMSPPASLPSVG